MLIHAVFHYSLPTYLSEDLERVQKRALKIIFNGQSYSDCLPESNLQTLYASANCTPKEPLLASCPTSHTNSTIYFQDEIVTIALETIDILTFRIVKLNVLRTLL